MPGSTFPCGLLCVAALTGTPALAGCSTEPEPDGPPLVYSSLETGPAMDVELISDMLAPKDIDSMRIIITWPEVPFRSDVRSELGTPSSRLPQELWAQFGGGGGPADAAPEITDAEVTVWKGAAPFTVARASAPYPRDGKLALRLSISWLCAGTAKEIAPGQFASTCPAGQSCRFGSCQSNDRSAEKLPIFDQAVENTPCFDAAQCMANAQVAVVDHATCTIAAPAGFSPTNIAVVKPPQTEGACTASQCLVALNEDPIEGFSIDGVTIRLPATLCTALDDGRAQDIVMSDKCPTKHPAASLCDVAGAP